MWPTPRVMGLSTVSETLGMGRMDLFPYICAAVGLVIAWGSWKVATNEYRCELAWVESEYKD